MNKDEVSNAVLNSLKSRIIGNKNFIIAANWKMNKNSEEAVTFLNKLVSLNYSKRNEVVIFPPSVYGLFVKQLLSNTDINYGLQNMYFKESGAFTGEISPLMVKDLGCKYVLLGHSERRSIFGETDELINSKIHTAIKHGIAPMLCIGEVLEERQSGIFKQVLKVQLVKDLKDVSAEDMKNLVIAYEPVWAIGTGLNATPQQAEETHLYIREVINELYGHCISNKTPILYGGSVKSSNAAQLGMMDGISGFLIGGAGLDIDEFSKIITLCD
jgi:triosephosphate isomerase